MTRTPSRASAVASRPNPVTAARRGPSLNVILIGAVVVVAALIIGAVLWFNRSDEAGPVSNETLVPVGAHTLSEGQGADAGKVTLVEFLDYQCPACVNFYEGVTSQLEQEYDGRITFVVRNYPLQMHPLAVPAARAAEAAGLQGKWAEMYHALYDTWQQWASTGQSINTDQAVATTFFEGLAQDLGLDVAQFRTDMASDQVQAIVDRDQADGTTLDVSATPTFFLNGEEFQASGSTAAEVLDSFRAEIDEALAG
ncbi:DsbA family protein [Nakamurella leprariae]|uniref:Thioredoxin domain-containing protein n=1 Tax=Nakamurella leprariae TaxID=2803911 RepID=A0A939C142_9ACTN|nr:thioredoxin domain-containing protein [Nakamurella leprariae]MBM9469406.1 thioredoxin domain-containing protein [Nakamurella leprariae]